MTTKKAFWITAIFSVILFLILCWSTQIGPVTTPYWVETLGYFIFTYFCLAKFSEKVPSLNIWAIACAAILGRIFLEIPVRIIDFSGSLCSILITVSCIISILLASVCFKYRTIYSFIISCIILSIFNSVIAIMWEQYALGTI